MLDDIDLYCERTQTGLWDEPLNVISNLAFILAALLALRHYRAAYAGRWLRGWDTALLILLLAAIGIGSALWHLYAKRWAELADVIPILLFINVYLLAALLRVAGLRVAVTLGLFLLYHGVNVSLQTLLPAGALNGSVFYVPTWGTLLLLGAYLYTKRHPRWPLFAGAGGVFCISLGFRTVDMAVCGWLPTGTHFLWHLLNGFTLYLLVRALLPVPTKPAGTA